MESLPTSNEGWVRGLVTLKQATELLRGGQVVAIPTETVYGLAAVATDEQAVLRVFETKHRPPDNPLIVHVHSIAQALQLGDVGEIELNLMQRFWPGPLTIIVPRKAPLPRAVTAGLNTVALRMPGHELALELIAAVGSALVAPSANPSGMPSPTRAQHVLADFNGSVPVLDGGETVLGIESTVVRIVGSECVILRPGAITEADLADVGLDVLPTPSAIEELAHSPGTRYRHYAPNTPMRLFADAYTLREAMVPGRRYVILAPYQPVEGVEWQHLTAQSVYAQLREADEKKVDEILVLCAGAVRADVALMDRLLRAAGENLLGEGT